jgi:hypothetical protein
MDLSRDSCLYKTRRGRLVVSLCAGAVCVPVALFANAGLQAFRD